MKDEDEETRLRSAFGRLREEDEAGTPRFTSLIAGARSIASPVPIWRRRSALVLAAAVVILVIAIGLMDRKDAAPYPIDLGSTHWRGPTDFLLTVTMDPALTTVPRIGVTDFPWRTP